MYCECKSSIKKLKVTHSQDKQLENEKKDNDN